MLASHALVLSGVPLERVFKRVNAVRDARYGLLRGFFHGASDAPEDLTERLHLRLHTVPLPAGGYGVGRTLGELCVEALGVEVMSVRRRGTLNPAVTVALVLEAGDMVVLKGVPETIARAEARLLAGDT